MFITRINKTVATIGMSLVLAISAAPATADNMDVLGQFLQQNFPDSPYLTKSWQSEGMPWWRYWK